MEGTQRGTQLILAAASLPPHPLRPAGVMGDWWDHYSLWQNTLFNRLYQEDMGDLELLVHWPMA